MPKKIVQSSTLLSLAAVTAAVFLVACGSSRVRVQDVRRVELASKSICIAQREPIRLSVQTENGEQRVLSPHQLRGQHWTFRPSVGKIKGGAYIPPKPDEVEPGKIIRFLFRAEDGRRWTSRAKLGYACDYDFSYASEKVDVAVKSVDSRWGRLAQATFHVGERAPFTILYDPNRSKVHLSTKGVPGTHGRDGRGARQETKEYYGRNGWRGEKTRCVAQARNGSNGNSGRDGGDITLFYEEGAKDLIASITLDTSGGAGGKAGRGGEGTSECMSGISGVSGAAGLPGQVVVMAVSRERLDDIPTPVVESSEPQQQHLERTASKAF